METAHLLLQWIDAFLIAPYRWPENPLAGMWLGNHFAGSLGRPFGDATHALVYRVNRHQIEHDAKKTIYYHDQSIKAKGSGDEASYKEINRLANDSFGKSYFLLIATGMASLWPPFLAAAWLNLRFGELDFQFPAWAGGFTLSFIAPFIICYIAIRVLWGKVKKKLGPHPVTPLNEHSTDNDT